MDYGTLRDNFVVTYLGRITDQSYSDLLTLKSELKLDGKKLASTFSDVQSWFKNYDGSQNGVATIELQNDNFLVDGVLGGNEGTITIDLSSDDIVPPTLTMLQFRNTENEVISSFNNCEEATMWLSAADFKVHPKSENTGDKTWYDALSPVNVTAEISLEGQNDFMPVELTEKEDMFFPVYFGNIYCAPLSVATEKGWYDLRLTITDEAGNSQEQIVRYAFYMEQKVSGLSAINTNEAILGEVYNLQGMPVKSINSADELNNLPAGIYIINGQKIAVK